MAISSAGIGSNLDVNGIVSQLMTIESRPLTQLATKEASYQAKLSGYGSLKGVLASFQSALSGLNDLAKFQKVTATAADTSILTGSATSIAAPGTYSLEVNKLAQSQKLVAAGQSSTTASIGNGTITIDFGSISGGTLTPYDATTSTGGTYTGASFSSSGSGVKTITIDGTNNSLSGIRDAINNAKIGVTAAIVNDGGTSPYRLTLSTEGVGKTNSMKISVAGDTALSDLLGQDPAGVQKLAETSTAQNAELKVNGVLVSKASNSISDAIQGVTLNLLKTTSSATSITVARDSSGIKTSVDAFVKSYNDVRKTIKDLSSYDTATGKGAILQGDPAVLGIQAQLRSVFSTPLVGAGAYKTLSDVGISFQKDGSLSVDSGKLQTAITNNFSDIAGLFASAGKPSNSLVNFVSATSNTKPGSYPVNVTQVARQADITGNVNLNAGTTTIAAGTTLNVALDSGSATVTLAAGTYTASQLALMVQSSINGTPSFSSFGYTVNTSIDNNGYLKIASNRYGSESSISISSATGTSISSFLGTVTNTSGQDVAGTIDGKTATGSGQYLTGAAGSSVDSLKLQITGTTIGDRGVLDYSNGYAYRLNKVVEGLLSSKGTITSHVDGVNQSIKDLDSRRESISRRLATVEQRYRTQFTKLDTLMSSMSTTSSYLTQQLASLAKL